MSATRAPEPCRRCIHDGNCLTAGLVNRLAVQFWLLNMPFECADYQASYFRGIEGVFA